MSKHQPSPWTYRLKQQGNGYLIVNADDSPFADVYMTNEPKIAENTAKLFAAAPDLLEACKAVAKMHDGHQRCAELNIVKAAIQKAEAQ